MDNCSLFVSPVFFLFQQGYIICPVVTHLMEYTTTYACKGLEATWAYITCALLAWLAQLAAILKNTVILEQALKCCRNRVFWSTMTTSQWWVNVVVMSPNVTAKTHSCDQRLSVTNNFFCLAEARLLVTGFTVSRKVWFQGGICPEKFHLNVSNDFHF